jgi:hypothetical protein
MIDLITEAGKFQTYCRSLGWDFCFIGGLALQDVSSVVTRQGGGNLDWDYIMISLEPLVAVKEEPLILERLTSLRDTERRLNNSE